MIVVNRLLAELVLALHVALTAVIFFGWLWPELWWVYVATVVGTLIFDTILGYCLLSKWEFELRRKCNPSINYEYEWTVYYVYKLTGLTVSTKFVLTVAYIFLPLSLGLNVYFRYFY